LNPPQSGILRRFSARSFSQGGSIPSPERTENPSNSPRFAVKDFEKSGFLFNRGAKRSQYFRIGEYFNDE